MTAQDGRRFGIRFLLGKERLELAVNRWVRETEDKLSVVDEAR